MKITWRDAVTSLGAVGAVVVERAYFENYDWPLMSSMNWVLVILGAIGLLSILVGHTFDKLAGKAWNYVAMAWAVVTVALAGLGMYYEVTDYVVLSMLNVLAIWIVSVAHHFLEHPTYHGTHTQAAA